MKTILIKIIILKTVIMIMKTLIMDALDMNTLVMDFLHYGTSRSGCPHYGQSHDESFHVFSIFTNGSGTPEPEPRFLKHESIELCSDFFQRAGAIF